MCSIVASILICFLTFRLIIQARGEIQTLDLLLSSENRTHEGFTRPQIIPQVVRENFVPDTRLITGNKGDIFEITVQNRLSVTNPPMLQATSIHWHGIHQANTSWADGGVSITQCPIVPTQSFLYNFTVNQAGTFWYHSHYSVQYCDGLRGPFIVYDHKNDPYRHLYDFDNETTIITLEDWFDKVSPAPLLAGSSRWTFINGIGRGFPPSSTPPAPPSNLSLINVSHNKRYRFRLIGMACHSAFNFRIDNHTMTIIESDGDYTNPLRVDSLWIHAGQRYSVIVKADQPPANYWVRAAPLKGHPGFTNGHNSAILHYIEAARPIEYHGERVEGVEDDHWRSLHPLAEERLTTPSTELVPARILGKPHRTIEINQTWNEGKKEFLINGETFHLPANFSLLLDILRGVYPADSRSVITLEFDKVYELRIRGVGKGQPHPLHLHGQSFYVIKAIGATEPNMKNPPRRDTVDTGSDGDVAIIRFVTDNPGPWFFHCHIDWHLELGFAVVFAVAPKMTQQIQAHQLDNSEQVCNAYNRFHGDDKLLNAIQSGGK